MSLKELQMERPSAWEKVWVLQLLVSPAKSFGAAERGFQKAKRLSLPLPLVLVLRPVRVQAVSERKVVLRWC